jgi:hypothetical protein
LPPQLTVAVVPPLELELELELDELDELDELELDDELLPDELDEEAVGLPEEDDAPPSPPWPEPPEPAVLLPFENNDSASVVQPATKPRKPNTPKEIPVTSFIKTSSHASLRRLESAIQAHFFGFAKNFQRRKPGASWPLVATYSTYPPPY